MNNPYKIVISPAAFTQIKNLNPKDRKLIIKVLEALSINPRPPGATKISGMIGLYSEKVHAQRLIYKIEDLEILILLVKS